MESAARLATASQRALPVGNVPQTRSPLIRLAKGSFYTLSDFRGQPVWINFWGSWCPPCRAEMPDMQAALAQVQPQGMVCGLLPTQASDMSAP